MDVLSASILTFAGAAILVLLVAGWFAAPWLVLLTLILLLLVFVFLTTDRPSFFKLPEPVGNANSPDHTEQIPASQHHSGQDHSAKSTEPNSDPNSDSSSDPNSDPLQIVYRGAKCQTQIAAPQTPPPVTQSLLVYRGAKCRSGSTPSSVVTHAGRYRGQVSTIVTAQAESDPPSRPD